MHNRVKLFKKFRWSTWYCGEGTKADDRYDAANIKTMTKDGEVVVGLAKDLTADNVTVGQKGENGKDGVDGQIGDGKDGSGVAINGKDGSIGERQRWRECCNH